MKKIIKTFLFLISFLLIINKSFATEIINSDYKVGIVDSNNLNIRSGISTSFQSLGKLLKDEKVKIFGKIGEWYIIQTNSNIIGVANSDYIKIENEETNSTSLSQDEELLLNEINNVRTENNLQPLLIDDELQNIARLKAKDLVDNNYFSHYSETYGSPFDMLRNSSISYKVASENIAGNSDINKAVQSWLNSEAHRKNILSNTYNYTGVSVVNSITYGKILVELFIGK